MRATRRAGISRVVAFNRRMRGREADVGVWHETYLVRQGNYEAVYSGMPPHGLGAAGRLVPVKVRASARSG